MFKHSIAANHPALDSDKLGTVRWVMRIINYQETQEHEQTTSTEPGSGSLQATEANPLSCTASEGGLRAALLLLGDRQRGQTQPQTPSTAQAVTLRAKISP